MLLFKDKIFHLRKGKVLLVDTDTVAGFATDAFSFLARKNLYYLKKRNLSKRFSCAFAGLYQIEKIALINDKEKKIIRKYFPGKLTIVLKVRKKYQIYFGKTIAARIPDCFFLLQLLSIYNSPILLTSSNISGQKQKKTLTAIKKQFQKQFNLKKVKKFSLDEKITFKNSKSSSIIQVVNDEICFLRYGELTEISI